MEPRFAAFDVEVRRWFDARGWPVTRTHYVFDQEWYAWRHDARPRARTLYISQTVLEDVAADAVAAMLDSLDVTAHLQEDGGMQVVVVATPDGRVRVARVPLSPPR